MRISYTTEQLLLDERFVDYCLNPSSVHREYWEKLTEADPSLQKNIEEGKEILRLISPTLDQQEIAIEVRKLGAMLEMREKTTVEGTQRIALPKKKKLVPALRYALLGVVCIVAIVITLPFLKSGTKNATITSLLYESGTGERKALTLPDGSYVILSSNSKLTLSDDFNKQERRLELSGKAFFQVAKDASRPFIVTSRGFSTKAIGTAFYINAQDGNPYSVNLLEGKVEIKSPTEASFLNPGEQANWASNRFQKVSADTVYLRQWLNGNISFKTLPAKQAFSILEEWYSVKIEDKREHPTEIVINGDYRNESLSDILKVICFSLSCNYSISGDTIIIK